ncbi:MAG: glutamate--tRNA ligase family protein [Vicinamibacterales bacterium]
MPALPVSPPLVTRFAPAPTGFLHLGHVVNALCVWGWARARGAAVRLRVEDHDRQRSRAVYEQALLDDLAWLGFEPDGPVVHQRAREALYQDGLRTLAAAGLVYGCSCSRTALQHAPPGRDGERCYPGTCRARGIGLVDGVGWRVRLPDEEVRFDDVLLGPQEQRPSAQCGDLLIRDRAGNWTYQFAVVVDDLAQGISHVIRGADLASSTGRQILLARLLGRVEPPVFAHHPLVMRTAAEKLSKSDRDTGVGDLRRAGWTAADVLAAARPWAAGALDRLGRTGDARRHPDLS